MIFMVCNIYLLMSGFYSYEKFFRSMLTWGVCIVRQTRKIVFWKEHFN